MTLDDLIATTRLEAAGAGPLDLLASAAQQQQLLTELGEELLDHFVQEARAAGCSWSQVGAALGVSKQAAQQRHSGARGLLGRLRSTVAEAAGGLFTRFSQEAREAVVLAQQAARRLGHARIDTEHVLLGVIGVPHGRGARLLAAAGLDLDALRTEIEQAAGPGEHRGTGHIPFSPTAKKVLELSLRQALHLKDGHIGSEHILLGLLLDGSGTAATVLARHGVSLPSMREAVGRDR